jgi:Ca2+-binding RTX toxin-like protein
MPYTGTTGNNILDEAGEVGFAWFYMGDGDDVCRFIEWAGGNSPFGVYIDGGRGDDTLYGNAQSDEIYGSSGNDRIYAFGGADNISGGDGNDVLYGYDGNDRISGGFGDDFISTGDGSNEVDAGAGDDMIYTGRDFYNKIYGGQGFDYVFFNDGFARANDVRVIVDLLTGVHGGGAAGNVIDGVEGVGGTAFGDVIGGDNLRNVMRGEAGNDTLAGRGGNDTLEGQAGNDMLYGQDGDDVLYGDMANINLAGIIGDDRLVGGAGDDFLQGGGGRDVFVYTALSDSGINSSTRDYLTDLTRAQGDRIDVSAIDANALVAGNQSFVLDTNGSFSVGEIRQSLFQNELYLYFNTDADATPEMSIRLALRTSVAAVDFVL